MGRYNSQKKLPILFLSEWSCCFLISFQTSHWTETLIPQKLRKLMITGCNDFSFPGLACLANPVHFRTAPSAEYFLPWRDRRHKSEQPWAKTSARRTTHFLESNFKDNSSFGPSDLMYVSTWETSQVWEYLGCGSLRLKFPSVSESPEGADPLGNRQLAAKLKREQICSSSRSDTSNLHEISRPRNLRH